MLQCRDRLEFDGVPILKGAVEQSGGVDELMRQMPMNEVSDMKSLGRERIGGDLHSTCRERGDEGGFPNIRCTADHDAW